MQNTSLHGRQRIIFFKWLEAQENGRRMPHKLSAQLFQTLFQMTDGFRYEKNFTENNENFFTKRVRQKNFHPVQGIWKTYCALPATECGLASSSQGKSHSHQ
jgi:hypothetical protein